jgi:outer membrane protein assembly factor BamB
MKSSERTLPAVAARVERGPIPPRECRPRRGRLQRYRTLACALLLPAVSVARADWPHFRGPGMDGRTTESILADWPKEGPRVAWKIPLGESFGSFVVRGGTAYCFMERDQMEACVAFDARTGKELWATPIDKTIFEHQGGNGPRSTPSVDGEHVYLLGTYLKLACLKANDGKIVWQRDLVKDFNGQINTRGIAKWGNAASPVVDGDRVFLCGGGPGESLMAFDKKTGELAWKREDEKLTHATPTPATIHGVRQIIFFVQSGLVSVATKTGDVLWRYPFPWATSTAASPVVAGDIVFCSAGYNVGAGAVRISKTDNGLEAKELWRMSGEHQCHWTTPVHHDGHLYGLFGFKELGRMPLKCIELATGKEKWSKPGFGQGGLILVGKNLLVQGDQGQLVLAEATPEEYRELSRAQPLGGKCWTMPVVSSGHVFARSTKEGVCLDVSGQQQARSDGGKE